MLSSVLRSEKAIQVNIEIMRAFVEYRGILRESEHLHARIDKLDEKVEQAFRYLLERIDALHEQKAKKLPLGFHGQPKEK
jgi:hypothetical protein